MRKFLFLILFAASARPAFGQGGFTTVNGTITDPNGIPWSGGTITAQLITPGGTSPTLNGVSFSGTSVTGILGLTGSFTIRLGDSGVILPSGTTWQFTVSIAPGVLPPAGKGPQSFTVTTAINCSTNTPAACAGNAMNITAAISPVPSLVVSFFTQFIPGLSGGAPGQSLFFLPALPGSRFQINSNGGNTDTFEIINGGNGRVQFRVDAAITNQTFIGNNVDGGSLVIGGSAVTGILNLGNTSSRITAQAAPGDLAGTLTCAASTATKTFTTAYTSTPTILVFDETTKGGVNLTAKSATAFTVSCTGATDALDYIVIGNPN
jgi:hypothetical protein